MGIQGFQDLWLAGTRVYGQRDAVAGVQQPFLDLGIIQEATPAIATTKAEVFDPDGGVRKLADSALTQITEAYNVTCSNMSLRNLALMFQGNDPESFTQAATEVDVQHYANKDELLKIKDSTGTFVFNIANVLGIYDGTRVNAVLSDIIVSSKTIKLATDLSAAAGLQPGKSFIVSTTGLVNPANARTYTVVSIAFSTTTNIVVSETPAADETGITGQAAYVNSGGKVYDDETEWTEYSLARGIVRWASGVPTASGNVQVVYVPTALSGSRIFYPQSIRGQIRGTFWLVIGRSSNGEQTVREFRGNFTPGTFAGVGPAQEFATMSFTLDVIVDLTSTKPAGRMLYFIGSLPTVS